MIEDNVRYYSSFLPAIYAELLHHSQRLISEGAEPLAEDPAHARAAEDPALHAPSRRRGRRSRATSDDVLGVISDVEFPRERRAGRPEAGLEFARAVRASCARRADRCCSRRGRRTRRRPATRSAPTSCSRARRSLLAGAAPLHARELRLRRLRVPHCRTAARWAAPPTCAALEETAAHACPAESIAYHAERNHFSNWLKARTEFALAHALRPRKRARTSRTPEAPAPRPDRRDRRLPARARPARWWRTSTAQTLRPGERLPPHRRRLAGRQGARARLRAPAAGRARAPSGLPGVRDRRAPRRWCWAPTCSTASSSSNDLRDFALRATDDDERCAALPDAAAFPADARRDLRGVPRAASATRWPCARRACSRTRSTSPSPASTTRSCCANNDRDLRRAPASSCCARSSASTPRPSRAGPRTTSAPRRYRLEEEKMAVILQQRRGRRARRALLPRLRRRRALAQLLPVAAAHRPRTASPRSRSGSGARWWRAATACGSARAIPQHLLQFSSVRGRARATRSATFWALDLARRRRRAARGALRPRGRRGGRHARRLGSTYSPENDAVYDGMSRPGVRLVSFAPVLKHGSFPLAEILDRAARARAPGAWARRWRSSSRSTSPCPKARRAEFGFLQMRPLALTARERGAASIGEVGRGRRAVPQRARARQRPARRHPRRWWSSTASASTARRAARRRPQIAR